MKTPLISIIIPTYNRAHLIVETLDSVLTQTYANWECIIVDDGSSDNSTEVINAYVDSDSRFLYFIRPNYIIKGVSACRNFGIKKSTGDYIIFLDSDDLLAPQCLNERITFALLNPEFDFWIFKMLAFEKSIENVKFIYDEIPKMNQSLWCKHEFMEGRNPFVVTGPLWKRNTILKLEGFDEQLTMIEDPDLHLRALKNNYQLKFAEDYKPDCYYRLSTNIKNKYSINLELENDLRFFKKHLNKSDKAVFVSFKKIINSLIFDHRKYRFFFRFYILGFSLRIFSFSKFWLGLIIMFYKSLNLDKFKMLGYNKLKKLFNDF